MVVEEVPIKQELQSMNESLSNYASVTSNLGSADETPKKKKLNVKKVKIKMKG